jgi:GntR family transcriptional regulator of arabinose operon
MAKSELLGLITIADNKAVPKYKQLQTEIKRLIGENALRANTRLPGENEFMDWLGLSRTTIRKALQTLEDARLIYRVQGQGTYVGGKPVALSKNGDEFKGGRKGRLIGVLVPNITNEIYPPIIDGIEKTVQSWGGCVFTANSCGSHDREQQLINEMINNSVEGLIVEPLYSGEETEESRLVPLLETLDMPVVLLNNDIPSFECSKVIQDDEGGGRMVTEHILKHGHKRIAYIYNNQIKAAYERRKGYRKALAAAGIDPDPALEFPFNEEQRLTDPGYVLTTRILENPGLGVTAIFYFNDDLALQGLEAVRAFNLEIPRHLSIAGYDDIPRSKLSGVSLTTVSHPKALLGTWAASLLLEQFERRENPVFRKITVHSSMVCRYSVAAPADR